MARYQKALIDAFKPHFKELGFTKRNATWHLETVDAIHVFNIQKSQWGENYYFNAGIYFRALGFSVSPTQPYCHIRTRIPIDETDDEVVRLVDELSDFQEVESGAEERVIELKNLIYPLAFDWFYRFRDTSHVALELGRPTRPKALVSKSVWPILGLKIPY